LGAPTAFAGWSLGWPTPTAWVIAFGCVALGWRRRSALARLNPPNPSVLLEQLLAEPSAVDSISDETRRAAIAELNQRIADVSFELGLLPATFTALTRISLASGSALALFGFMESADSESMERTLRVAVCAVSGLVGAGVVASIGRSAKLRVAGIREAWDRSSREIGKSLGTGLE
jgi:hypothetical protein